MILHFGDAGVPGAVGATIESIVRLYAMSDDLAAAVITNRRKFVDRTLEAVKGMTGAGGNDFKRQVIIITAHFTFRHH